MSDESFDETMIVPKLDPPAVEAPPTRKLVEQYAPVRPRSHSLLWFFGAVVLTIGFLTPLEQLDQRQLERALAARTLMHALGQ
ncbi:MAG: hypothetical protein HOV81_20620 [Kofleriaceae bacterium]|nr:hypothetical protein [Kofleriaceae bacterium]